MTDRRKLKQQGFTIIELLIATAILSTILVTVTIVMINIGNLYYKGVSQALVQDATRSIKDEIAQRLELSSQPKILSATNPDGSAAYCMGNTRYTYIIGVQIDNSPPDDGTVFKHVLWRDTIHSADTCETANLVAPNPSLGTDDGADAEDGIELMISRGRLISFSITPSTSPYKVLVGLAYGDDDLLCSPSVNISGSTSCSTDTAMPHLHQYQNGDLRCKSFEGQQFCSTSNLSATVVQRLTAD